MKKLLWLDDARDPHKNDWLNFSPIERPFEVVWVKSYYEFVSWIGANGMPDGICFDHDLADVKEIEGSDLVLASDWEKEMTGYDCAKWLVAQCLNYRRPLPAFNIQSANPVGAENIRSLLSNFKRHTQEPT